MNALKNAKEYNIFACAWLHEAYRKCITFCLFLTCDYMRTDGSGNENEEFDIYGTQ